MIKVLEQAIEKIKKLPEDKQAYAAEVLEQLVADADAGIFDIPDDHLDGVLEGLDQARRGEFATDTELTPLCASHGAEGSAHRASRP